MYFLRFTDTHFAIQDLPFTNKRYFLLLVRLKEECYPHLGRQPSHGECRRRYRQSPIARYKGGGRYATNNRVYGRDYKYNDVLQGQIHSDGASTTASTLLPLQTVEEGLKESD